MSEINNLPELTLEPAAAAVPELTLEPVAPATPAVPAVEEAKPAVEPIRPNDSMLSEAEKQAVEEFAKKIDIMDSNMILQYGAAAQKNVAGFSENALASVRTKDMGEVGKDLADLVVELKGFGAVEEKKGLFGLFKKSANKLETMKAQYSKVEANVDRIVRELEQHQVTLLKDVAMLDQMYELNLRYYKELTMYILAGQKKLAEVREVELPALRAKAEQTGAQEDAQAYNDKVQMCERFEKKLHDLELTRMISIQMGPQTRLLQNNDTLMVEDPVLFGEHHSPVEEPDGVGPGHGAQPSGYRRPERCHRHDQRLAAQERRPAEDGHHRDGQGGRAQRGEHRDPAAYQPAADLHAGRGAEYPAGGRRQAPRGRG